VEEKSLRSIVRPEQKKSLLKTDRDEDREILQNIKKMVNNAKTTRRLGMQKLVIYKNWPLELSQKKLMLCTSFNIQQYETNGMQAKIIYNE
jgi:ribosomal protein L13